MDRTTCRCEVCSSEILVDRQAPAARVCLLCRLSAEEAVSALEETRVAHARQRGLLGAGSPRQQEIPAA